MMKKTSRIYLRDSSVLTLITIGVVCVAFMLAAGGMVYSNTRRSLTATDWVAHTQDVLHALRSASQVTERVDANARLYLLTHDSERLHLATASADDLEGAAARLQMLVSDNSRETTNASRLVACGNDLSVATRQLSSGSDLPKGAISSCLQTINTMFDLERVLLTERSKVFQGTVSMSLTTEFVFIGVSLVTLVALFAFLLRAAELRLRSEKQKVETKQHLEHSIQLLQDQADETMLLTTSRDELQLCLTLQDVYSAARIGFERLVPEGSGALAIITNSRNMMEIACTWGDSAMEDCHIPESCCGLRLGQTRWRRPFISEIHCNHFSGPGPDFYVCIPVVAHGDTLGLLYLECPDATCMESVQKRMNGLQQLVQLTGMAVAAMKLRIKLENQSIRDPLTGLFNRHFMEIALDREISRAKRRKSILAVYMVDVDHFKDFNDLHGHAVGDAVLKSVAEICQQAMRAEDIVCRYGGEEFTIIVPEVTPETAYDRADTLRATIENHRAILGGDVYADIRVSFGVSLYPEDGIGGDALLRKADQALYRAKKQGRNQVVLSSEPIFAA